MTDNAIPAPKRRWFAFSLRTLVIAVPVLVAAGYWIYCENVARLARAELDVAFQAWEDERLSNEHLLALSDDWFQAAITVPFANKKRVYTEYLNDLTRICKVLLIYIATSNPNDSYVRILRDADRRYRDAYQQLQQVANDNYVADLKAIHDQELYSENSAVDRRSPYHPLNRMPDDLPTLAPENTGDVPSGEDPFPPE